MCPPAYSLQVVYIEVPKHLQSHKRILFHINGAKEGVMKYPNYAVEEKEGGFYSVYLYLCASVGQFERIIAEALCCTCHVSCLKLFVCITTLLLPNVFTLWMHCTYTMLCTLACLCG